MSLSQCCSCVSCVPGQVAGLLLPHLAGTAAEGAREYPGRVVLLVRPAVARRRRARGAGRCRGGCTRLPAAAARRPGRRAGRRDRAGGAPVPLPGARLPEGHVHRAGRRPDLPLLALTPPLAVMLAAVAAALCGRAGTRLAAALGTAAPGRATMTRLVMTLPVPEPGSAPRVLGGRLRAAQGARLRHRAGRRGNRAGRGPAPGPQGRHARDWLQGHPGAEVICRDRAALTPTAPAPEPPPRSRSPTAGTCGATWATRPARPPRRTPGPAFPAPGRRNPGRRNPGRRNPWRHPAAGTPAAGTPAAGTAGPAGRQAKARRRHAEVASSSTPATRRRPPPASWACHARPSASTPPCPCPPPCPPSPPATTSSSPPRPRPRPPPAPSPAGS